MAFVALTVLLAATLSSGHILPFRPVLPFLPFGGPLSAHSILHIQANNAQFGLAAQARAGALAAAGAQQTAAAHAAAHVAQNAAAASERFAANAARLSGSGTGSGSTAVSSVTHSNPNGRIYLAPGEQVTIPIDYGSGGIQGYQHNQPSGPGFMPDPGYGPGSVDPGFTQEPGYGPGSVDPGFTQEPGYAPGAAGPGFTQDPGFGPGSAGPGYTQEQVYGPGSMAPEYIPQPAYVPLQSPMPNPAGQNTVTFGAGTGNQPQPNIATNQIAGGQQAAYIPPGSNAIATAQSTQQQTVAQQTNAIVKNPTPTTYINPLPASAAIANDPFAANNGGGNAQMITVNMVDPGLTNSIIPGRSPGYVEPGTVAGPGGVYFDPATSLTAGTGGAAALTAGAGATSFVEPATINAGSGATSFVEPATTSAGSGGGFVDPAATLSAGSGATSFVGSQNNAAPGSISYVNPATVNTGGGFVDPAATLSAGSGATSFVGSQNNAVSGGGFVDPAATLSAGSGATPFVGSQNNAASGSASYVNPATINTGALPGPVNFPKPTSGQPGITSTTGVSQQMNTISAITVPATSSNQVIHTNGQTGTAVGGSTASPKGATQTIAGVHSVGNQSPISTAGQNTNTVVGSTLSLNSANSINSVGISGQSLGTGIGVVDLIKPPSVVSGLTTTTSSNNNSLSTVNSIGQAGQLTLKTTGAGVGPSVAGKSTTNIAQILTTAAPTTTPSTIQTMPNHIGLSNSNVTPAASIPIPSVNPGQTTIAPTVNSLSNMDPATRLQFSGSTSGMPTPTGGMTSTNSQPFSVGGLTAAGNPISFTGGTPTTNTGILSVSFSGNPSGGAPTSGVLAPGMTNSGGQTFSFSGSPTGSQTSTGSSSISGSTGIQTTQLISPANPLYTDQGQGEINNAFSVMGVEGASGMTGVVI
ncbi:hypothetical protein SNE40_002652 [Patella caerulea]|uniref:Uncharacterized protein n=1 Tax=Patella caerulea TaxID=87958 RepID=A0AAN8Q3E9_PATCE